MITSSGSNSDGAFSGAFVRATEPHAAWGVEQLEAFNAFVPPGPWTADLSRCVYRQGGVELTVGLLGTFDASDGTWMWGWANPGFAGAPVVAAAEGLRRFGTEHGVAEFSREVVDLSGFPDPATAVEQLAFGAMGVLGALGYMGVEAGPGTRAYLLADDPQVPRAAPQPVTLPRVLLSAVGLVPEAAPRAVVTGYFTRHALPWRPTAEGVAAELPDGSTAAVAFDAAGRIASVDVGVPGRP
ncbi:MULTISPECIES: DUF6882 domain-containing protein [unclassified Streptomyces]|uniref:DUF6882 domain-containing protein n=1 Tax=unclassified Streptomyces TaxID=2593676 RepID=UPI0008DE4D53|nr:MULTISPECIES: DUF6882 domain-containing protein [unclassified Streptomyces]OII69172.1 hypothetical protein BJP39_18505 [Streptomyces sp. CC77]